MTASSSAKRQLAAALLTIAVLMLLLAVGGIWAWRASQPAAAAAPLANGPLAKVAAWVEPPPPPRPNFITVTYTLNGVFRTGAVLIEEARTVRGTARLTASGSYKLSVTSSLAVPSGVLVVPAPEGTLPNNGR